MAVGKKTGGRKKGVANKITAARKVAIADAVAKGVDPLHVMLENMAHFQQSAIDAEKILKGLTAEDICGRELEPAEQFKVLLAEVKKAAGLRQMAQECARDAAPYVHAKLASMTVAGDPNKPLNVINTVEMVIVRPTATDSGGI